MRGRLAAAFVGLTVVVLVLYGVPRAYVLADLVRSQEQTRVDRTAALAAEVLRERGHRPVTTTVLDRLTDDTETIVVTRPSGGEVRSSYDADPEGSVSATVDVTGGASLTVWRDGNSISSEVGKTLLPLVLLGLLLAVLAGAAGFVLADRFSRPFKTLAVAARGLGAGQLHPQLPDYRFPEARAIAAGLTTSGAKLDALLQHERDLLAHASHELRTPVTALRLSLEDLARWPETTPAAAAELDRSVGELDRLSGVIDDLLSASRDLSATAAVDVDLDALVAHTVATSGHAVRHVRSGRLATRIDPDPVVDALSLLLGDGARITTADRGTHLEVSITRYDAEPSDVARAADLVAASGGQLARVDDGVLLRVPKREVAG